MKGQFSPKAILFSTHVMRSTVHKVQPELTVEKCGASDRYYSTQRARNGTQFAVQALICRD